MKRLKLLNFTIYHLYTIYTQCKIISSSSSSSFLFRELTGLFKKISLVIWFPGVFFFKENICMRCQKKNHFFLRFYFIS